LPIAAEQLASGTVIVRPPVIAPAGGVARYTRVASPGQQAELDRPLGHLAQYAAATACLSWTRCDKSGCGHNGQRRSMLRILRNPGTKNIVVGHRERLAVAEMDRFGNWSGPAASGTTPTGGLRTPAKAP
jgi:putative resolvase